MSHSWIKFPPCALQPPENRILTPSLGKLGPNFNIVAPDVGMSEKLEINLITMA